MVKRGKKKFRSSKSNKIVMRLDPPLGIKIVSVFFFISAILSFLFGVLIILGSVLGLSLLSSEDIKNMINNNPGLSAFGIESGTKLFTTIFAFGVFIIVWGIIEWYVGKGLWRAIRIWYVAASVLILIGLLTSLALIFSLTYSGLVPLVFYIVLAYLLWVNKNSRSYFGISSKLVKKR